MMTDGLLFYPGDLVCYSERHYEWMKMAARWPSVHIPRTTLTGKVITSTATTVTVAWKMSSDTLVHFPDSLEHLDPPSGHEKGWPFK